MLPYVPVPLPDELLFSYLHRLGAYNALTSPTAYRHFLFGTSASRTSADLPCRLAKVGELLDPYLSNGQPFDVIWHTTLYPYFLAFVSNERSKRALAMAFDNGGRGIRTLLGIVASRMGANVLLRSCRLCDEEMLRTHGAIGWLRRHQLPGVTACAWHGTVLDATLHEPETSRHLFFGPVLSSEIRSVSRAAPSAIRFSSDSAALLATHSLVDPDLRRLVYEHQVRRLGFVNGRAVDHVALAREMRLYFEDFGVFPQRERLLAFGADSLPWVTTLLARPRRSSHPVFHLLLIEFLFGTVENFEGAVEVENLSTKPAPTRRTKSPPRTGSGGVRVKRQEWQGLLREGSLRPILEARRERPAVYAWLYRNDRDWLMSTNRTRATPRATKRLVDWNSRDAALCARLKSIEARLQEMNPAGHSSKTRLLANLGGTNVRRNLTKLPRLKASLEALVGFRQ